MTSLAHPPMCTTCVHLAVNHDDDDLLPRWVCTAYPSGVPVAVLMGADHRLPLPNDQGVQYEPTGPLGLEQVVEDYGAEPQEWTGDWPGVNPMFL